MNIRITTPILVNVKEQESDEDNARNRRFVNKNVNSCMTLFFVRTRVQIKSKENKERILKWIRKSSTSVCNELNEL